VTVHKDNTAAETLANLDPGQSTPTSKFCDVEVHLFWLHLSKDIKVQRIDTKEQLTDIFTKPLANLLLFYFEIHLISGMEFHGSRDAPLFNPCAPPKELKICFCNHSNMFSINSLQSNSMYLLFHRNDAMHARLESFPSVEFTRMTSLAKNGSTN